MAHANQVIAILDSDRQCRREDARDERAVVDDGDEAKVSAATGVATEVDAEREFTIRASTRGDPLA